MHSDIADESPKICFKFDDNYLTFISIPITGYQILGRKHFDNTVHTVNIKVSSNRCVLDRSGWRELFGYLMNRKTVAAAPSPLALHLQHPISLACSYSIETIPQRPENT